MFKIRKGNTRIAIILFNFLVIKIPNPRFYEIKDGFKRRKSILSFIKDFFRGLYFRFLHGVIANVTEALIWYGAHNSPMLMPVWSIGLFNFCRYYGEEEPTRDEIIKLLTFCVSDMKDKEDVLRKVSPHSVAVHNWRRTKDGKVILIDYGVDPSHNDYWGYILRISGIKIGRSGWPDLS
jgi:hypothetical protein